MIPLSRVRLTRKNGGYIGVAEKMQIFGQKMGPGGRPEARRATGSTQLFVFLVSIHDGNKTLIHFVPTSVFEIFCQIILACIIYNVLYSVYTDGRRPPIASKAFTKTLVIPNPLFKSTVLITLSIEGLKIQGRLEKKDKIFEISIF